MEIVFLGTGGGRINLIKQIRATGGFRINSRTANIHVDPGPGALLQSIKYKQSPLDLDVVIITHNHIDHVSDAMVLIEGMSSYGLKRKGIIIGSRHTIEGNDVGDKGISKFHLEKAEQVLIPDFDKKVKLNTAKGSFEFEAFQMQHEEPTAIGFKIWLDGSVLGYVSDTSYFDGLGECYKDCDTIIINCIKPEADEYGGHLDSMGVAKVLKIAKPKSAVLTHFGLRMLKAGTTEEAKKIETESGVKILAAKDGMRLII